MTDVDNHEYWPVYNSWNICIIKHTVSNSRVFFFSFFYGYFCYEIYFLSKFNNICLTQLLLITKGDSENDFLTEAVHQSYS